MWHRLFLCLLLVASVSCQAESVGKQFFKEGFVSRTERLEAYPLEEQWKIFLYANQVVHPPLTDMALPIARRGKPALDYILQQLEKSENDLDFRDSLVVFRSMQGGGFYNLCSDEAAMKTIQANESKIDDPDWRSMYNRMLGRICPAAGKKTN